MKVNNLVKFSAAVIMAFSMFACSAAPMKPKGVVNIKNVALFGYDSVEYFVLQKETKGSGMHTLEYDGATWLFASRENKETFEANPEKYIPAFGGYDALEVAEGNLVEGDPKYWRIHNRKIYLFEDEDNLEEWFREFGTYLPAGEKEWALIQNPPKEEE